MNHLKKNLSILALTVSIFLFLSCGGGSPSSSASSWEKDYEAKLNSELIGKNTGIKNFRLEESILYIEVDSSVPTSDYSLMARSWAKKFSEEKQKHGDSEVTAFIILNSKAVAREEYSNSGGFR